MKYNFSSLIFYIDFVNIVILIIIIEQIYIKFVFFLYIWIWANFYMLRVWL